MQIKSLQTIIFIIFRDSLIIHQIFVLAQVKQCAVITIQTWYMRVPSQVLELLKAYDLQKLGNVKKVSKFHRMIA